GGGDREERRVGAAAVLKPVDRSARDANGLAGSDLDCPPVDRPRRGALQAIDRLLEPIVAMGRGHPGVRGYVALEHSCAPVRVISLDEKADAECADRDCLSRY